MTKEIEINKSEVEDKLEIKAKDLIANNIQSYANDVTNEQSLSLIEPLNDEKKGSIISRETSKRPNETLLQKESIYSDRIEEHKGNKFLLVAATKYVIDDYDPVMNSVELSHYEELGYFQLKEFEILSLEFDESLDLTWMNKNDTINFSYASQNQFIRNMKLNIDNLNCSYLPMGMNGFKNLNLEINSNNTELKPIMIIKTFMMFLKYHCERKRRNEEVIINSVVFDGFSPLINAILSSICKKYEISVLEKENTDKKSKKI